MNNKGQELNPVGIIGGVIGGVFGWWMSGRMMATAFWKITTTLVVAVVLYFMVSKILDN